MRISSRVACKRDNDFLRYVVIFPEAEISRNPYALHTFDTLRYILIIFGKK